MAKKAFHQTDTLRTDTILNPNSALEKAEFL